HVAGARRRLQHAIDIEVASKHRGRRVRVIGVAAIVAVVSLLGLAVFLRASPAEAALGAIAEAARTATAAEIPDGSFFYTRSTSLGLGSRPGAELGSDREYVAYLLPSERKVWQSDIGDFIQIEVRDDRPIFFDSADEVAYYSIGL